MHTTSVMKTEVEAETLHKATVLALQKSKNNDWKTTYELETSAK